MLGASGFAESVGRTTLFGRQDATWQPIRRQGGAYAARARWVLAQQAVGEKTNEITAIPDLLSLLDIAGAIVSIDAMGCQKAIAQTIIDAKADYVLALKDSPLWLSFNVN